MERMHKRIFILLGFGDYKYNDQPTEKLHTKYSFRFKMTKDRGITWQSLMVNKASKTLELATFFYSHTSDEPSKKELKSIV